MSCAPACRSRHPVPTSQPPASPSPCLQNHPFNCRYIKLAAGETVKDGKRVRTESGKKVRVRSGVTWCLHRRPWRPPPAGHAGAPAPTAAALPASCACACACAAGQGADRAVREVEQEDPAARGVRRHRRGGGAARSADDRQVGGGRAAVGASRPLSWPVCPAVPHQGPTAAPLTRLSRTLAPPRTQVQKGRPRVV